jgi:Icc-related predicted phosphoesterase
MRIVAVADTHLFHRELVVPHGDVLIHAGDLCRGGSVEEIEHGLGWLRSLPHATKIFVAGNHDMAFESDPLDARAVVGEGITYLEDEETTVAGVRFWGSPWQPEFNEWAFNLPRGAPLAAKWSLIPEGIDVLVTHSPPNGVGDRSSVAGRQGCADLLARVKTLRPKLHLFGHIHEDGGAWTVDGVTFVNVTTWECERAPTVIDLDVATGECRLVDVPPARHR